MHAEWAPVRTVFERRNLTDTAHGIMLALPAGGAYLGHNQVPFIIGSHIQARNHAAGQAIRFGQDSR